MQLPKLRGPGEQVPVVRSHASSEPWSWGARPGFCLPCPLPGPARRLPGPRALQDAPVVLCGESAARRGRQTLVGVWVTPRGGTIVRPRQRRLRVPVSAQAHRLVPHLASATPVRAERLSQTLISVSLRASSVERPLVLTSRRSVTWVPCPFLSCRAVAVLYVASASSVPS